MIIFADDTTIINAGKRTDPLIRKGIVTVSKCFEFSKVTINTHKCEVMFFGFVKPDNLSVLSTELGYKISRKFWV